MMQSFMLGVITLTFLFFMCYSFVLGVKTLIDFTKKYLLPEQKQPTVKIARPKRVSKKPRVVKSIEINPDEVERIYVKKSV